MSAYRAKAIVAGLMLAMPCATVAGAGQSSDFSTLQAAARAAQESRTAQAEQQAQPPSAGGETQESQGEAQPSGGLTESQVRVMLGLAWSIVPEQYQDPEGRQVKVDKANPNRYLVPVPDARRIIRAASRSAYAQICNLEDRQAANHQAMMQLERKQKNWSTDQLMFINTLHLFAVGQMTGNVQLVDEEEQAPADASAPAKAAEAAPPAAAPAAPVRARAGCPPAQKEKVQNAIDAYVAAVEKEVAGKATP